MRILKQKKTIRQSAGAESKLMEKSKVKCWLQEAGMLVITVIACFVAAFLFGYDQYEITRLILLTIIASGCMIFVLEESRQQRKLLFDNEENIWRFVVLYLLGLVGSVGFPLLPAGGWPYLPIFIGLMLRKHLFMMR